MNNASQGYLDEPGPTNNMYVHIYKYLYSVYTALDINLQTEAYTAGHGPKFYLVPALGLKILNQNWFKLLVYTLFFKSKHWGIQLR